MIPNSTRSPSRASTATSWPATASICSRWSSPPTRPTATRAPGARKRHGSVLRSPGRAGPTEPSSGEPVPPEGLGSDPASMLLGAGLIRRRHGRCDELYGSADSGSAPTRSTATRAPAASRRTPVATARRWRIRSGTGVVPTTAAGPATTAAAGPATMGTTHHATTTEADDSTTAVERRSRPSRPCRSNQATSRPRSSRPVWVTTRRSTPSPSPATTATSPPATTSIGADPGTPYRSYGDTCAGRQPEGTGTWCVDAFGAGPAPSVP